MTVMIRQTVTEIQCDTSAEAADLLRALQPTSNERGLVELHAFTPSRMLGAGQGEIMRRAQEDADFRAYKANRGTLGRLGWSAHGKPSMPGREVYDPFELELMGKSI